MINAAKMLLLNPNHLAACLDSNQAFLIKAILTEDGKLVLGDLRSKGGEEWSITGKSVTPLTKEEKKIIDLALLPGNNFVSIILQTNFYSRADILF